MFPRFDCSCFWLLCIFHSASVGISVYWIALTMSFVNMFVGLHWYRAKDTEKHIWIQAIKNHQQLEIGGTQLMLCELHFDKSAIKKRKDRTILAKGTYPTIFPGAHELHRQLSDQPNSRIGNSDHIEKTNEWVTLFGYWSHHFTNRFTYSCFSISVLSLSFAMCVCDFRLHRRVLDMEINIIRMNERNESLEKKLAEKTKLLEITRKKLIQCENELAKLKKLKNKQLSIVQSDLLNVCIDSTGQFQIA